MADNDNYEDEYQFADPDAAGADSTDYNPEADGSTPTVTEKPTFGQSFVGNSSVIRNALVVVGLIVVVMVIYPFIHASLSGSKTVPAEKPVATFQQPITPVAPMPEVRSSSNMDNQISQKLSTLESTQERIQTEYLSTNGQLSGMNTNINDIMTKITELNTTIALYAAKVDEQSRIIEQLAKRASAQKLPSRRPASNKTASPSLKYFMQAVIPGRAWLIATNGSTLTVREGTMIAGLGMVTLIDPRQGRVLTSSGQVIRFSQEDS